MKLPLTACLLFGSLLPSCIPLKQGDFSPSTRSSHFFFGEGNGLLTLGNYLTPARGHVIAEESFAGNPSGQHLKISVQPHDYDIEEKSTNIRTSVFVYNPRGKPLRSLENGPWKFSFLIRDHGTDHREVFSANISTFYYCPFIHGPPA